MQSQKQVIGQAELLPVLIAKMAWREELVGRPVLTFIDNDSARFSLVAGNSPSVASSRIIAASSALDARLAIYPWISRVRSESNPADGPSRGDFDGVGACGSRTKEVPLGGTTSNVSWALILRALEVDGGCAAHRIIALKTPPHDRPHLRQEKEHSVCRDKYTVRALA